MLLAAAQVKVTNPLAVADYAAAGIKYIPETEETIAQLGHLADDSVLMNFDQGVMLGADDFVDPTLAFGDPGAHGTGVCGRLRRPLLQEPQYSILA